MTGCIEIAAWVLAVIGALIFIPSAYKFIWTLVVSPPATNKNVALFVLSFISAAIGATLLIGGLSPYVSLLPCITVVP
jgi:hypothetical protein